MENLVGKQELHVQASPINKQEMEGRSWEKGSGESCGWNLKYKMKF